MAGASVPHSSGYSQLAQPGADSTYNPLLMGESVSHWTHHQEHTLKLSAYAKQPHVGGHYVGKDIPLINARSIPRYDETSNDDNYQPGLGAQSHYGTREPGLAHPGITRGCQEWLSHCDWFRGICQACASSLAQAKGVWHSATTCCGLGACQTVSPGALGTNARLPRRWKCGDRHVQ